MKRELVILLALMAVVCWLPGRATALNIYRIKWNSGSTSGVDLSGPL